MKTESEIRMQGMHALISSLDLIEAERFLMMVNREKFDYTQWRSKQWSTETVASLTAQVKALRPANEQVE